MKFDASGRLEGGKDETSARVAVDDEVDGVVAKIANAVKKDDQRERDLVFV